MQNNTQPRDTGQSSDCVPVQVQDNDMNVSSNAPQSQVNSGPNYASSHNTNNQYQSLQQQQLQILAACNAATAYASHQHQTHENRTGAFTNPSNLSTITQNSTLTSGTVPPAFMMNFLMAASAMGFTSGLGTGMNPPFPLTTLGLAAAATCGHKPKSVLHTPGVFQHSSLRSGKWIEEEEKYAELLIELFEKGNVPRCENGSTLRSFLSQKLHCAPMRVSKKYAGKGIGKLVYNDRSKVAMTPEARAEHKNLLAKVLEAQEKFHKAALPIQNTSSAAIDCFGSFPVPHLISGSLPSTTSQSPIPGTPFTSIQPSLPMSSRVESCVSSQGRSDTAKNISSLGTSKDDKEVSNQEAAKALLEESAKLLRQSFLAAFYQADNATSNVKDQTDRIATNDDSGCSSTQQHNPVHLNQPRSTTMNESRRLSKPEKFFNYRATLPDLLPTFVQGTPNDNALAQQKHEAISQQQQSNSCALTSKSFDELHLFPGNDCIPGGNLSGSSVSNMLTFSPSAGNMKRSAKPDALKPTSNPLFTAESYAMFAVESAMAASQHDAYLPCSRVLAGTTNDNYYQHAVMRSNSIDNIDGMVNLLAEQSKRKEPRTPTKKGERQGSSSHDAVTKERVRHEVADYGEETEDNISSSCEDLGYTATYEAMNIKPAYVSASERSCNPSTETGSSSALESSRDSTNSENTESSASDGGSSSESLDSGRNERRKREHTISETESRLMSRDIKRFRKEASKVKEDSCLTYSNDINETTS